MLVQSKALPSEKMIDVSDEISFAIQEMAGSFGFSEELEQITKAGIDLALKAIQSSPPLKKLLKNLNLESGNYLAIHSSRLPYLANHLTKMMGWDSESTAYKMAFAALIHDSTLDFNVHASYEHGSKKVEDLNCMLTASEIENFVQHTKKAAEIAAQFRGVPPDVDMIIAQHHETCGGTGFPYKLNHTRIAPLSCVFIIAHELLIYYESHSENFKIEDFIALKQDEYFAGYFKKILVELALFKIE